MAVIKKALIVGGGFSGMCAAIQLRKAGVETHLVEIDAGWRAQGAGLTISGPTLRAFGTVGVLQEVIAQGYCSDSLHVYAADGRLLTEIPMPRVAGPDVPATGGIMRPVLAKILANATRAAGTHVRLGCTYTSIEPSGHYVDVSFSDDTRDRFDLVVGADGLSSRIREHFFPNAPKPRFTGQGVWRAVVPRPADRRGSAMYMGASVKAGFNPVSQEEMYLFLTEMRTANTFVPDAELLPQLESLLAEFTAPAIARIREGLGPQSRIVYRPLEALLLPPPWYMGPVLLIGDATHATTPHLASGAGMGIEDAIVLAEELEKFETLSDALAAFQQRRWGRCRLVVENSLRLGEIEATGGSPREHAEIMLQSSQALAGAI